MKSRYRQSRATPVSKCLVDIQAELDDHVRPEIHIAGVESSPDNPTHSVGRETK